MSSNPFNLMACISLLLRFLALRRMCRLSAASSIRWHSLSADSEGLVRPSLSSSESMMIITGGACLLSCHCCPGGLCVQRHLFLFRYHPGSRASQLLGKHFCLLCFDLDLWVCSLCGTSQRCRMHCWSRCCVCMGPSTCYRYLVHLRPYVCCWFLAHHGSSIWCWYLAHQRLSICSWYLVPQGSYICY